MIVRPPYETKTSGSRNSWASPFLAEARPSNSSHTQVTARKLTLTPREKNFQGANVWGLGDFGEQFQHGLGSVFGQSLRICSSRTQRISRRSPYRLGMSMCPLLGFCHRGGNGRVQFNGGAISGLIETLHPGICPPVAPPLESAPAKRVLSPAGT